ncbi:hypothetical protein BJ095_10273 [Ureibacillus chungkukjangi]|uniref:Uncharacterized protein n=1 Tax=Ureibacillus chungkukjangi TaxID=1202712 RepID=A0A318TZ45_9BACL|nr:hypothetical protein BJ095_10273 [Ureibacillus chungkukjangi]
MKDYKNLRGLVDLISPHITFVIVEYSTYRQRR